MAKKGAKQTSKKDASKQTKTQNKATAKNKEVKTNSKEKVETKVAEKKDVTNKSFQNLKNYLDFNLLKKLIPVVLILFIMWYAFFIRSGPIDLDGLDERIEANTYSQIQNIIAQQVQSEYPNLNEGYRQEEIQKRYQQVVDTGELVINGQKIIVSDVVEQNVKTVKDGFKADNNQTYLNAIDSYHYFQYTENMIENGHMGTSLKENEDGEMKPYVFYKLAPNGRFVLEKPDFHVWLETKLMEFNGVTPDSPVGEKIGAIFLIPVIFAMLSVIPAYLIIRKFSNDLFAFMGSMILVSIGTFVSRTVAGFVDTDAYNVFFPLVIIAFLLYAFTAKNNILKIILSVFAGLFMGLYLWAWGNGWFIFVFSLLAFIGYIGYIVVNYLIGKYFEEKRKENKEIKNDLLVGFSFLIVSVISTYLFIGQNIFVSTYTSIFKNIDKISSISQTNIWPNVFSSVAELNQASFAQVVGSVGGGLVFFVALLALVFLSIDFKSKDSKQTLHQRLLIVGSIIWFIVFLATDIFTPLTSNNALIFIALLFLPVGIGLLISLLNNNVSNKVFLTILLSAWFAGTIYMSLNGVRFVLLMAPVLAISFALGLYNISKIINTFATQEFELKKTHHKNAIGFIITIILFVVFMLPAHSGAIQISHGSTPNFDDTWYSVMDKIEKNSNESAIITSWWDFGHFFAAIANRGVTFDGGSQTTPASHWVGKLLMENDEEVSVDILRMLVCGNNNAFDYMLEVSDDETNGVLVNKLIYETFGKTKEEKVEILENNQYFEFDNKEIDEIMQRLHCDNPPQNFLITSGDMVGKAGVWAHWGSWDFTKKYVHDNYKKKSAQEIADVLYENVSLIKQYVSELEAIDVQAKTQDIKREDLINRWLADYPSYIPLEGNKYQYPCQRDNMTLVCQNSMRVNLLTSEVESQFGDQIKFKRLIMPTQEQTIETVEMDPQGNVDAVFVPTPDGYTVMLAQYPLGNSLFTRLYYYDGMYSNNYFEEFTNVNSITGVDIKTWDVQWEANESAENETFSMNMSDISNEASVEEGIGEGIDLTNNS